ncbi:MAG: S41 family peptidase [Nitrospinae bacterium]|nr:S41 family peptidase [Nitrospinota bacterium]
MSADPRFAADAPSEEPRRQSRGAFLLTFLAALALGVAVGSFNANKVFAVVRSYDHLETFADVLTLIESDYVEEVAPDKLIEGAIDGMLRSLDPHSSYMTPEMFKEMQVETEGEFGGLGIEITMQDGWLTVVTPMEETPAWKSGLKPGDKIIKVDGAPTHDMSLMDAVRKMRGKRGTPVTLTIAREGFEEPRDYTIVRDIIHVASVKSLMLPDTYGYVRIRSFSKDTGQEMRAAIETLKKQGMKGLVLDLRNNPGGLLNQAVEVSEYFLKKGELVVYTKGRMPNQNMRFTAKNPSGDADYPLVVLVNQGSASASEIVAGALQDLKRAIVVGTTSFGKGSVQTIIPLRGDAGLRLTTARYYTPSGRQIQGVGILPDIKVDEEWLEDKTDAKKGQAVREKDLHNHLPAAGEKSMEGAKPGDASKPNGNGKNGLAKPVADPEHDVQLQRAMGILKSWDIIRDVESRKTERKAG